jgi:dihydrofolate reductase
VPRRGNGAAYVALTAGNLTGQAIAAGLVDELAVNLVPVVFGSGVRFFGDYAVSPLLLDNPQVVQGGNRPDVPSAWG